MKIRSHASNTITDRTGARTNVEQFSFYVHHTGTDHEQGEGEKLVSVTCHSIYDVR